MFSLKYFSRNKCHLKNAPNFLGPEQKKGLFSLINDKAYNGEDGAREKKINN